MESIDDYRRWLQGLGTGEREKYDFLTDLALWHGSIRAGQLREQHNMRFASISRKNLKSFAEEELARATDELTRISFPCDWRSINREIVKVREKLQWRKSKDPIIVTEEQLEEDLVVINNEEDELLLKIGDEFVNSVSIPVEILFKHLMYDSHYSNLDTGGLSKEYLQHDYSDADYTDFDYSHLRDFDKIVELIGRLWWLIKLLNIIADGAYDQPAKENDGTAAKDALIAFYKGEEVPRGGKNPSAKYKKYVVLRHDFNRLYPSDSIKAQKNRVELFLSVIEELARQGDKVALEKAKNDFEELRRAVTDIVLLESDLKSLKKLR